MILRAQIFISAVIRTTGSTQSIRETRYAEPDAGYELTEEHSDVWKPYNLNFSPKVSHLLILEKYIC